MTNTEWMDKYQDGLLESYYKLSVLCLKDETLRDAFRELEAALVKIGLLEADEEPEEAEEDELDYTNDASHWDEWNWDMKVDELREQMEYER